ncbi:unnamed protein product [Phaeothamnion confervicola]
MADTAELRTQLATLETQRRALEAEADAIGRELNGPGPDGLPPIGLRTPLVDRDGFPLAGYDVYRIRHLRHRLSCIQTDHKEIMARVEGLLHAIHERQRQNTETERPSLLESSATPAMNGGPIMNGVMNGATGLSHHTEPFCRVNEVWNGSPAAAARLRAGDLLVDFGSVHAGNHGNLSAIVPVISDNVGREIAVRVLRGGAGGEFVELRLMPRSWDGRGLMGCHLTPLCCG